jgi:NAD(P)-dependent dehydrogenase (short-subunit alcohol dehydrogenase family)
MMDDGLDGKVAVVTGGASGIGRATAAALAGAGARTIVVDRDADALAALRAAIPEIVVVPADVADAAQVDAAHDAIAAEHGGIDVAINNAGVTRPIGWLHETPESSFDDIMAVNLRGVWLCLRAQLRHMHARRAGVIVNTASAASFVGAPGVAPYTAAKHGVLGLTRAAALEYAGLGIRINAVAPGTVDTPMSDAFALLDDPFADALVRQTPPLGRLARAEEVADAILFLAGDRSTFATGSVLTLDGGFTAQ